jgi:hypothetical protein
MTNYEFLKSKDNLELWEFAKRGILPIDIMTKITIYEFYLNEQKTQMSNKVAVQSTADKYNLHFGTIYRIINFMKS